jgi:hypothetical protein
LLGGSAQAPVVLDRQRVELSDPADPQTRQPYHAGTGTAEEDPTVIAHLSAIVEQFGLESLTRLVTAYRNAGHAPSQAAVVMGSQTNPLKLANLHMRAHAYEGQLFAAVLAQGLRRVGLEVRTIPERDLMARATAVLHRTAQDLRAVTTTRGARWAPPGAPTRRRPHWARGWYWPVRQRPPPRSNYRMKLTRLGHRFSQG